TLSLAAAPADAVALTKSSSRAPARVASPTAACGAGDVVSIWGGARHCIVLLSDGSVWDWGLNAWGMLGDGTASTWPTDFSNDRHLPVRVHGPGNVGYLSAIAVMGGEPYDFALASDGTVWSWGANTFGELGDGTNTDSSVPVQVSGLGSVIALGGR